MLGDIVAPSSCLHRNLTQASMGLRIVWIEQRVLKEHLSTESLPGSHRTAGRGPMNTTQSCHGEFY